MKFSILIFAILIFSLSKIYAQSGSAVYLEGSSSYISTPLDVQPAAMPVSTWEAWVYPERVNYSSRQQVLSDDDGNHDRSVLIESGTASFAVFTGSQAWLAAPVTMNEWQHIAVVFLPDNILFYKNGVEYSLGASPGGGTTSNSLKIGMNPGFGEYFKGKIDNVRIWNVQRSQAQILSGMTIDPSAETPGMIAWYKLDETGSGPGITVTNSASTGSIYNGITIVNPEFSPVSPIPHGIPADGLRLWLKSDSGLVSEAGKVTSWTDISGNGFSLISEAGSEQPLLVENEINNLPAVVFDGVNDFLQTPSSISLLGRDSLAITVTLLLNTGATQLAWANILDYDHDSFAGFTIQQNAGATNDFWGHVLNSGWQVVSFELVNGSSGFSGVYIDGIQVVSNPSGGMASFSEPRRLALGRWESLCCNTPGRNWNGEVAEVLIHNRTLSESERLELQTYFQSRYGTIVNPLPVEMTSFTGSFSGNQVTLKWQTATETINYGWEVEIQKSEVRSQKSEENWKTVGFVEGKGTTTVANSYSFLSPVTSPMSPAVYRLKQIDLDGNFTYSELLEMTPELPAAFAIGQNYPNPFNPETRIRVDLPDVSEIRFEVFNLLGQLVKSEVLNEKEAGSHLLVWNGKDQSGNQAASGVYFYRISLVSLSTGKKFTETRSMVMVK
ncbi:MAG: T9SS type A sorting domain-containing protein [Bacteroidetes bacterium]|nr:T9SS type A sorting domain-containing protein [Bacteroidota bacterium]